MTSPDPRPLTPEEIAHLPVWLSTYRLDTVPVEWFRRLAATVATLDAERAPSEGGPDVASVREALAVVLDREPTDDEVQRASRSRGWAERVPREGDGQDAYDASLPDDDGLLKPERVTTPRRRCEL